MKTCQGFSLTEVLVSLLLMTTTSLALLKQQWHTNQLLNQVHFQTKALRVLDNASERLMSGSFLLDQDDWFALKKIQTQATTQLKISWDAPTSSHLIERELILR